MIKLRYSEPKRRRPFKVPFNVRFRGGELPIPSVVGALLTFAIWIVAIATHPAARYAGPAWLAAGLVIYFLVRRERGVGLLEHILSTDEQVVPETTFARILVPMKLGDIGEEMVATAVKLAEDGGTVVALHVIRVPLDLPLDAPLDDQESSAAASLARRRRSAPITESRSRASSSGPGRSARRSSPRRRRRAPT